MPLKVEPATCFCEAAATTTRYHDDHSSFYDYCYYSSSCRCCYCDFTDKVYAPEHNSLRRKTNDERIFGWCILSMEAKILTVMLVYLKGARLAAN